MRKYLNAAIALVLGGLASSWLSMCGITMLWGSESEFGLNLLGWAALVLGAMSWMLTGATMHSVYEWSLEEEWRKEEEEEERARIKYE